MAALPENGAALGLELEAGGGGGEEEEVFRDAREDFGEEEQPKPPIKERSVEDKENIIVRDTATTTERVLKVSESASPSVSGREDFEANSALISCCKNQRRDIATDIASSLAQRERSINDVEKELVFRAVIDCVGTTVSCLQYFRTKQGQEALMKALQLSHAQIIMEEGGGGGGGGGGGNGVPHPNVSMPEETGRDTKPKKKKSAGRLKTFLRRIGSGGRRRNRTKEEYGEEEVLHRSESWSPTERLTGIASVRACEILSWSACRYLFQSGIDENTVHWISLLRRFSVWAGAVGTDAGLEFVHALLAIVEGDSSVLIRVVEELVPVVERIASGHAGTREVECIRKIAKVVKALGVESIRGYRGNYRRCVESPRVLASLVRMYLLMNRVDPTATVGILSQHLKAAAKANLSQILQDSDGTNQSETSQLETVTRLLRHACNDIQADIEIFQTCFPVSLSLPGITCSAYLPLAKIRTSYAIAMLDTHALSKEKFDDEIVTFFRAVKRLDDYGTLWCDAWQRLTDLLDPSVRHWLHALTRTWVLLGKSSEDDGTISSWEGTTWQGLDRSAVPCSRALKHLYARFRDALDANENVIHWSPRYLTLSERATCKATIAHLQVRKSRALDVLKGSQSREVTEWRMPLEVGSVLDDMRAHRQMQTELAQVVMRLAKKESSKVRVENERQKGQMAEVGERWKLTSGQVQQSFHRLLTASVDSIMSKAEPVIWSITDNVNGTPSSLSFRLQPLVTLFDCAIQSLPVSQSVKIKFVRSLWDRCSSVLCELMLSSGGQEGQENTVNMNTLDNISPIISLVSGASDLLTNLFEEKCAVTSKLQEMQNKARLDKLLQVFCSAPNRHVATLSLTESF